MLVNAKRMFPLPVGYGDWSSLMIRAYVQGSANPARIYSQSGALLNADGKISLSPEGSMDVWMLDSVFYRLDLYNVVTGYILFSDPEYEPSSIPDFTSVLPMGENIGDVLTWTNVGPQWQPPTGGGSGPVEAVLTPTTGAVEFTEDATAASFVLAVCNVNLTAIVSVTPALPAGITASVQGNKLKVSGLTANALDATDYTIVAISVGGYVTYTLTLSVLEVIPESGWLPSNDSELMYFDPTAFPVPVSQKANLQNLLDQHNVIRLEGADYTGGVSGLLVKANQKIYGIPRQTILPGITIVPGTTGAVLRGFTSLAPGITFPASPLVTKRNVFSSLVSSITSTGGSIEENVFASFLGSIVIDVSVSGSLKNNRFYKPHTQLNGWELGTSPLGKAGFWVKGMADRSNVDGNVLISVNGLNPQCGTIFAEGGKRMVVIGWDDETYHLPYNGLAQAYVRNYEKFSFVSTGGNPYNTGIDTGADSTFIVYNDMAIPPPSVGATLYGLKLSDTARFVQSWDTRFSDTDTIDLTGGLVKRLRWDSVGKLKYGSTVFENGQVLSGSNNTDVLARLVEPAVPAGKVWPRYQQRAIPDPLGPTWNVGLSDRTDESAAIQALLDANMEVQLEPRAYYINQPLYFRENQTLMGTRNETVIVAMRPDLDMLQMQWSGTRGWHEYHTTAAINLIDLVLQGGNSGLDFEQPNNQLASHTLSYVTFRDMTTAGIWLNHSYGMDNGFIEYLNFYRCGKGVLQRGSGAVEADMEMYSDKTPFYRCQFIECGDGMDLQMVRSNNMMSYIECLFKDCTGSAIAGMGASNYPVFVNCQFLNNGGTTQVNASGRCSFTGCLFQASSLNQWLIPSGTYFEGCVFQKNGNDTVTMMDPIRSMYQTGFNYLSVFVNCTSDVPLGIAVQTSGEQAVTSINSQWPVSDTGWSAPLSHILYDTKDTPTMYDNTKLSNIGFVQGAISPGTRLLTSAYDITTPPEEIPYDPSEPLARWKSGNSVAGKRVTFLGDSTTAIAPGIFDTLRDYITPAGGEWEGAVVTQLGYNGQTIDGFLAQSFQELVATNPALVVVCLGLNNVRLGQYSRESVRELLDELIVRIQTQIPLADIVLWTPNSMLSEDAAGMGTVVPVSSAQDYTDRVWNAHNDIKVANIYQRVAYLDKQEIHGRICQPTSPLMNDILHPNGLGQAKCLEPLIEMAKPVKLPIDLDASAAAWAANPDAPWTVYARALEDTRSATFKRHLTISLYSDQGNNNRLIYFFNRRQDQTPLTTSSIAAGDIIWTPNGVYTITGSESKYTIPGNGLQMTVPLNQFPPIIPTVGDVRVYSRGAPALDHTSGNASFFAGAASADVLLASMTYGSLASVASVTPSLPTGLTASIIGGALHVSGTSASVVAPSSYTIVVNITGGGTATYTLTLMVSASVVVPVDVTFNGLSTDTSLTDALGNVWTPFGGATLDGVVPSGGGFQCVDPDALALLVLGTDDYLIEIEVTTTEPNVTLFDLGAALGLPMGFGLNGGIAGNPLSSFYSTATGYMPASMSPYGMDFANGTRVKFGFERVAGVSKLVMNNLGLFWADATNLTDYSAAPTKIVLGSRQSDPTDRPFIGTIHTFKVRVGPA